MTPEPKLKVRFGLDSNWSPKKRRNVGSFSNGGANSLISLLVNMLTTDGMAMSAALAKLSGLSAITGGATSVMVTTSPRGRHDNKSGRSVDTTKKIASKTVAVCAKNNQSL